MDKLVLTPGGYRPAACHVQVESGTKFEALDDGRVRFESLDGTVWHHEVATECHQDNIVERYKAKQSMHTIEPVEVIGEGVGFNGWIDYAGWYPPAPENSLSAFTATYTVPQDPTQTINQVLFYFIGMQDNAYAAVNILQPVLTWGNGISGWNAASWACCPNNITVQSNSITGFKAGDTLYGLIKRVDAYDWTITTEITSGASAGLSTTLSPKVGGYLYNWADVTLEVYNTVLCSEYAVGPMTFSELNIRDSFGDDITSGAQWTLTGPSTCTGSIVQTGPESFVVQHG
jgi:hypothetical protein